MFGLWKTAADQTNYPVQRSDADWRRLLSGPAYQVLRQEGTERPYTSPLNNEHRAGVFKCAGCNWPVYSSKTKFESGTGWPSFWQPLNSRAILKRTDSSMLMIRTEVHCANCGGHLGHVFNDGPQPTGLRYCMNGVAMTFQPGAA
jgi:peptide-methionine (R)-S-oxide reductase